MTTDQQLVGCLALVVATVKVLQLWLLRVQPRRRRYPVRSNVTVRPVSPRLYDWKDDDDYR